MTAEQYIDELLREKEILEGQEDFGHAVRLLEIEIQTTRMNNDESYQPPSPEQHPPVQHGGLYKEEIVKLSEKIELPVDENPRFNFVGKIIGPKGTTMKAIQNVSKTRIMVLGKGSTRDREEEERLSLSDDPKYEHFKEPLHVVIKVRAPRSVAHEQLALAMEEINKCFAAENEAVYQNDVEERIRLMKDDQPYANEHIELRAPPPIIKVGIPPPGAIILNGQTPGIMNGVPPHVATRGDTGGRGRGRGLGSRGHERPRPY
jgi:hypothetical protein